MRFFKCFLMVALLCSIASAQQYGLTYHQVQVVDETGEKITGISSVEIYLPDTTTNATIYKDPAKADAITVPLTTSSTNTTLSNGFFSWWGPDGWDFSITDGTNIATNSGHRTRTGSDGRIVFPSYLTSISSTTYSDNETITLGTSSDWVINAGTTADLLTFTPATDGAVFRVGLSNGTKSASLQWYTASGVGLLISESADTLGITGLTTSINASSNYATNINTGTSTGAVSIGSSTAGAIAVDSTSTVSINSDSTLALSTTDATADITLLSNAGSVVITSTEASADDSIVITTAGAASGMQITSLADIDITTTGADGEDISLTNTGGSIILTATEAVVDAIVINASTALGGIDITSQNDIDISTTGAAGEDISLINTGGSVWIEATEAATDAVTIKATTALGGIDITSNEDIDITTTGAAGEDITITNTGGSVNINATENAAAAITLLTNGGTSETITVTNTQGTGAAAINLTATAGGITLTTGSASGVLLSSNAKTFRYVTCPISYVSATEIRCGGNGTANVCVGLTAGADETGAVEGYATVDDALDFLRFTVQPPYTWVDTGTATDLVLAFDILEVAAEECNIDVRVFEDANTTPMFTDTIVVANGASRAWCPLVTLATGIGAAVSQLDPGDHFIVEVTSTADADDFKIYGMRMKYRVGLQADQ